MSMGLPVVATDTPVHREYLGDDAVLAPAEPQALATAIVVALDRRSELAAAGARLRERVQTRYTWDHAAAIMDAAFRRSGCLMPFMALVRDVVSWPCSC